jgi:NAD-dependent SIR2 family protein deacetylase
MFPLLLKPHGSISWAYCTNCDWFKRSMHAQRAESALAGDFRCPECESKTEPVMVPPSRVKCCKLPFIEGIWERAEQVLRQASEIVFAGFSLDPTDGHIRDLLVNTFDQSRTRKIRVDTNPEELLCRYTHIYGPRVQTYSHGWKQYLEELHAKLAGVL